MPKNPTIAITGANGFLGTALVSYFSSKGWNVIALVRNAPRYRNSRQVTYAEYDLAKPVEKTLLSGVDYLVHTAYIQQDYRQKNAKDINIYGAGSLVKVSRQNRLKKNIFISSMSAHEGAVSVYGQQKLAIEKIFNQSSDINLRPGLIVGNGGIVKRMVSFMKKKHMVPLIGGGKQPLQIVAVDDLAKVIEKILLSKHHGTFTIATPTVYSYMEFYKAIARQLRIKVLFVPVPFWLLLALFKIVGWLHIPLEVNEDNLRGLQKLRAANTKTDLKKIGVELKSLEESLNHIES